MTCSLAPPAFRQKLHDSLKVAKSNNVEIQCGYVFAFDLEDNAVRLFGLTAEYPASLNQPLKIGGYADTQSPRIYVSAYSLDVSMYPGVHLVNIFKIIFTAYLHIRISTSIYT